MVRTEMFRYVGSRYEKILYIIEQLITPIAWVFIKSSEEGAQTTIYLASDIHLDNVSGKYFSDCIEVQPSKMTLNEEDNRRLWLLSEQMTKLDDSLKNF
ncbi:unnamed protein product [Rotaria sordida]|uniref:Uncharacterized protein n=2 Tax=Rotaria sordida TaxID=392033 RepID=A0A814JTQ4_9BILA|nr:unnamed protein product [Rotaria sordida]